MNDAIKSIARLAVANKMFPNGIGDNNPLVEENMILSHVGKIIHFLSGPNTLLSPDRGLLDAIPEYLDDVEKLETGLKQYSSACLFIVQISMFPSIKIGNSIGTNELVNEAIEDIMPIGGDIKIAFSHLIDVIVNKKREDFTSPELMLYLVMHMIYESIKWYIDQGYEQALKGYISEHIWEQVNRLKFD